MTLEDELDISRGNMIAKPNNYPKSEQDVDAMFCWLNQRPLNKMAKYVVKHTSNEARCMFKELVYKLDISTLNKITGDVDINMNDIFRSKIRTTQPLHFDSYRKNRITGSLIIIDEATNETVAAGMII